MNISKHLKKLFIRGGVYREQAGEASVGGGGPTSVSGATDAFSSLLGAPDAGAGSAEEESEESAAERLAADEAAAANQNNEDDAGQEQAKDANGTDDDTVTFEVDGKPVTMTKAELAEQHKAGMRQDDYTRKTTEAANTRKAAEAEIEKTRSERNAYQQKLHAFALTQESIIADAEKVLTQDLLNSDPVEYLTQERILRERQANLTKANEELQRIGQEQQKEFQEAQQAYLTRQHQALLDKVPEWKDAAKFKEGISKIESFMETHGFTAGDGAMVLDARVILLAQNAMKYQDLLKRAAEGAKKVTTAPPKVDRPGVTPLNPSDGRTSAMKRLEKSGSVRDAVDLFKAFT